MPNCTDEGFGHFLNCLESNIRRYNHDGIKLVIAGDFNARSTYWGDRISNLRGNALCALPDSIELNVVNVGHQSTFHGRGEGSIVNDTLAIENVMCDIHDWRVRNSVENLSDYHYMTFSYSHIRPTLTKSVYSYRTGWITGKINEDLLIAGIVLAEWIEKAYLDNKHPSDLSEATAETMVKYAMVACDLALKRRKPRPDRKLGVH